MSNLKDLFISQSFFGVINLENSLEPLVSASGDVELQDGLGDNLGLRINATTKEFTVVNNFRVDGNSDFNGDVDISGSFSHTGSLDVLGDITASGNIKGNKGIFDTVETRVLHVTQESASVIFSSGSNVLGDDCNDRQDLIGQVIVSCSLGVEGNSAFTGSLTVSNEISSSTVNGIGNVTIYSASVDSRIIDVDTRFQNFTSSYFVDSASFDNRIDQLELDTGSQDSRLDSLEIFTSSQETLNGLYNAFTASNGNTSLNSFTSSYFIDSASFDLRLDQQEAFSSSLVTDFVNTTEFNTYTASQDTINGFYNAFTASNGNTSLNSYTASNEIRVNQLAAATSSYASLVVDNDFDCNQTITGSVRGNVETLTIASLTSSIDCNEGNFFILSGSGAVHLKATNVSQGQTVSLRIQTDSGVTITTDNSTIKFSEDLPYTNSLTSSYDVLSFVSFDNTTLYGVAVNTFNI